MEIEEPFKTGFLFTPPQSFLRKSWPKRFCVLYNASSHGIQRLEIFDTDSAYLQSKSPAKILPLTDCVKVTPAPQKQQANVFEVRTKSCCSQFSADSFQEMTEWLGAIRTVAFGPVRPSSGLSALFPTHDVKQEENLLYKQEENLLYSSVDEPEIYLVRSLNTEAMLRNNLCGEYKLIVATTSIAVAEDKPPNKVGKTLFTWPYRHIRRYGCSKDNFSFEAGRKCLSGEGLFAFATPDGSVIFQSVDAHVSLLKSFHNEGEAPSSPFPDGDKSSAIFSYKDDSEKQNVGHASLGCSSNTTGVEERDSKLENDVTKSDKISCKAAHPISKPPRKSKQGPGDNIPRESKDGKSPIKLSSKSSSNVLPNMYENPESACSLSCSRAEKFLPNESDRDSEVIVPKVSEQTVSEISEPVYAILEESSFNMTGMVEELDYAQRAYENISNSSISSSSDVQAYNSHPRRESDFYDNLSLTKFDTSVHTPQNSSSGHVYGKLITSRPSSAVSRNSCDNLYGSLNTKKKISQGAVGNNSHSYSNVQLLKSPASTNAADPKNTEPKHFLRNNAEYAKVFKNRK